jgi:hypothetical protein
MRSLPKMFIAASSLSLVVAAACSDSIDPTAPVAVSGVNRAVSISVSTGETAEAQVGDTVRISTTIQQGRPEWKVRDASVLQLLSSGTVLAKAAGQSYVVVTGTHKRNRGQQDSTLVIVSSPVMAPADTAAAPSTSPDSSTTADPVTEPAPEPTPEPTPVPAPTGAGIWVSASQIAALPTSGAAWTAVLNDANRTGTANVADQNSDHDVYTLAAALVCARTGTASYCDKAKNAVVSAIGTEQGGRWLAVGRNMTAYVIAADILGLRADGNSSSAGSRVNAWIQSFLTMKLSSNNDASLMVQLTPFESGSNASAQEGAVYTAVAAYLKDQTALTRAWDAFRTYACDPTAPNRENIDLGKGVEFGWAHNDSKPCAVNPLGTTKVVPAGLPGAGTSHSIDGAIINDMRRGGEYQWQPGYTSYPWVGMEGFVPAAVLLQRAGYPAFGVADKAVLRAATYLWNLRSQTGNADWFDGDRAAEIVHVVNVVYGKSFPANSAAGAGRTVGYTAWTFPAGVN